MNGDSQKAVIVVDADHADVMLWRDRGLPRPNWIVVNRHNGHHHIGWVIEAPVSMGLHSRSAPIRLFDHIRELFTEACGGDRNFVNRITRNPLKPGSNCSAYILSGDATSLADLYNDIPLDLTLAPGRNRPRFSPRTILAATDSRNCAIFDEVRQIAYAIRPRHQSRASLTEVILSLCQNRNTFAEPLSFGEIQGIARSIAKWTWKHIDPSYVPREERETVATRPADYRDLSSSARRADMCRRCWMVRTRTLVLNVVALMAQDRSMSVADIADRLDVSRPTIYRVRASAQRILDGSATIEEEHPDIANLAAPSERRRHRRTGHRRRDTRTPQIRPIDGSIRLGAQPRRHRRDAPPPDPIRLRS